MFIPISLDYGITNDVKVFTVSVCDELACEQGEGKRKGKRKREEEGEPVGIHRYFDCSSFVIYAGPSVKYSNARNNNNNNKTINCVALKLEFRIHCRCMKLENWYHSQVVSFQL